jgi:REP element-mobilizing transposase RayT
MPAKVVATWQRERSEWLAKHGLDPNAVDWRQQIERLEPRTAFELKNLLSARWNDHLDACHGDCVLKRPELGRIVADSLLLFDGTRYELTEYVVMPNHVHMLVAFPDEASLLDQCENWKHFTATKINKQLGRKGRFWQQDGFDHLVRSLEQFAWLREYIAENPRRATLRAGQYQHFSKPL